MAVKSINTLLKRWLGASKKRKKAGFTLLELLISMLIAGVIISVLLSFVVDLVDTDRRENARAETQREMQLALDFMAADLREAVYVYDRVDQARGTNMPPLTTFLPDFNGISGAVRVRPILAFWKAERLPYNNPTNGSISCSPSGNTECEQVRIRRRAYSLVVYLQAENPPNNVRWKGDSRIMRYVLRKYTDTDNNLDSLTQVPGYVDPSSEQTSFQNWPLDGNRNSLQSGRPSLQNNPPVVLVDYVDNPSNPDFNIANNANPDYRCTSTNANSPFFGTDPDNPPYRRVPPVNNGANLNSNSFFVCVKTLATSDANNQDVFIYLRGNPADRLARNNKQPVETLRTQAIARGVIDKER